MAYEDMIISLIPALGAILLSLYNWYTLRQGGRIKPVRIVNYGLWSVTVDQRKVKNLFLPIILENSAIKSALVTDVAISFLDENSEKPLKINRRVDLDIPSGSMSGLGVNQFRISYTKEKVPFYPISVAGQEGRMIMLDCVDRGDTLDLDKQYKCKITATFGNEKKSSVQFPFKISSENYQKALDHIMWFKPLD